jgi:hypothetical protein
MVRFQHCCCFLNHAFNFNVFSCFLLGIFFKWNEKLDGFLNSFKSTFDHKSQHLDFLPNFWLWWVHPLGGAWDLLQLEKSYISISYFQFAFNFIIGLFQKIRVDHLMLFSKVMVCTEFVHFFIFILVGWFYN